MVGCWTCDQQVAGFTPGCRAFGCSLGQAVHTHHVPLPPSSINLVPVQDGKVTVGLASHRPCVTDNSDNSTYGLAALAREMRIPD